MIIRKNALFKTPRDWVYFWLSKGKRERNKYGFLKIKRELFNYL